MYALNNGSFDINHQPPIKVKALIDERIIIDVAMKSSPKDLADKYEVLSLAFRHKIFGIITDRGLYNIRQNLQKFLNGAELEELIKKLENDLYIYKTKYSNEVKHKLIESGAKGLDQKDLLISALESEADVVISSVSLENFQKFSQQLKLEAREKICILKPDEFLEWYDSDEEERLPLNQLAQEQATDYKLHHRNLKTSVDLEQYRQQLEKQANLGDTSDNSSDLPDEMVKIGDYYLENYEISCSQANRSLAKVTLWNKDTPNYLSDSALGVGPVDATYKALEHLISRFSGEDAPELYSVRLHLSEKGASSPVSATVILKSENVFYQGVRIHKDSFKAALLAYVEAWNAIKKSKALPDRYTDLGAAILTFTDLSQIDLQESNLENADLTGSNLDSADFVHAKMKKVILQSASLRDAKFNRAMLEEANFAFAKLARADLSEIIAPKAIFCYADLNRALFKSAWLNQTDFHNTRLHHAVFDNSTLTEADLSGADLEGASLLDVDLGKSNLMGANLSGVKFCRTNLEGANLTKTKVDSSIMHATLKNAIMPNGTMYDPYCSTSGSFEEFSKKYIWDYHRVLY
jgi:uncharacterized protein YjbI with pentapeptide repeats